MEPFTGRTRPLPPGLPGRDRQVRIAAPRHGRQNGEYFRLGRSVHADIDLLARQSLNACKRFQGGSTIAVADDTKLIFQTTDPSKQWVMYCLDTTNAPASVDRARIWYQTSTANTLTASSRWRPGAMRVRIDRMLRLRSSMVAAGVPLAR